ncbi:hypothetical protein UFOVP115_88 [uncultured Caudovirales phage]|uniref:Uncharacterized protein n=1 Tax=uncultured Caudovirales phage TaxID=2100421 RepID=A0A6J5L9Y1_9CAUD|nr:hypothetical protein UFOVP115_88 [uncultured Caudovirales phage]
MVKPTLNELNMILTGHAEVNEVEFSTKLTSVVYDDFMKWSALDEYKHARLVTLWDWIDEYAEFDCAYESWLDEQ